jgi:hypothetical protein
MTYKLADSLYKNLLYWYYPDSSSRPTGQRPPLNTSLLFPLVKRRRGEVYLSFPVASRYGISIAFSWLDFFVVG